METLVKQYPGRYTGLQGRVARILNARELVITIGADQGVRNDMLFAVLAAQPLEVRDPDTQEVLDTIDREKVRVKAVEVRPKVTICRTYRTREIVTPGLYAGSLDWLGGQSSSTREVIGETLTADSGALPEPLPVEQSFVKLGDRVIQISQE